MKFVIALSILVASVNAFAKTASDSSVNCAAKKESAFNAKEQRAATGEKVAVVFNEKKSEGDKNATSSQKAER